MTRKEMDRRIDKVTAIQLIGQPFKLIGKGRDYAVFLAGMRAAAGIKDRQYDLHDPIWKIGHLEHAEAIRAEAKRLAKEVNRDSCAG